MVSSAENSCKTMAWMWPVCALLTTASSKREAPEERRSKMEKSDNDRSDRD